MILRLVSVFFTFIINKWCCVWIKVYFWNENFTILPVDFVQRFMHNSFHSRDVEVFHMSSLHSHVVIICCMCYFSRAKLPLCVNGVKFCLSISSINLRILKILRRLSLILQYDVTIWVTEKKLFQISVKWKPNLNGKIFVSQALE